MNWIKELFTDSSIIQTLLGGFLAALLGLIVQLYLNRLSNKKALIAAASVLHLDIENVFLKLVSILVVSKQFGCRRSLIVDKSVYGLLTFNRNWRNELATISPHLQSKIVQTAYNFFELLERFSYALERQNEDVWMNSVFEFNTKLDCPFLFLDDSSYIPYDFRMLRRDIKELALNGRISDYSAQDKKSLENKRKLLDQLAEKFEKDIQNTVKDLINTKVGTHCIDIEDVLTKLSQIKREASSITEDKEIQNWAIFKAIINSNELEMVWGKVCMKNVENPEQT